MFVLTTKQLQEAYRYCLAIGTVLVSYWFNQHYITQELGKDYTNENPLHIISHGCRILIANVIVQTLMAYFYNMLRISLPWHDYQFVMRLCRTGTYLSFLIPTIFRLLALPVVILKRTAVLAVLFPVSELQITFLVQGRMVVELFARAIVLMKYMVKNYGLQTFLENQWIRLQVPSVLRVFWITRVTYQAVLLCTQYILANHTVTETYFLSQENLCDIGLKLLIHGCETFTALLGMTSIVSYITHHIGLFMALFIGSENEEDRNMGTVCAILFFILALQTGLTGLSEDKRLIRLYRNLCLLSTAILHFIHSMVNPLLMSLSASRNLSLQRHLRALFMCFGLIAFPCWFLYYLWSQHSISTWLLAVTAFNIEIVIKVLITLLVYTLFMIDAYREVFWEKLDDYVYYIKSTGNTIEFLFGIFLFCNGAWIMVFESGGTIRAIMMCVHAYFNIWVQAKEGWKVFMKRRTAVNKINSLTLATKDQLDTFNDVCAICYQELATARVTRCNHYFHGVCLRKWLYVQDRCPLCHELIYMPESNSSPAEAQNQENQNRENQNHVDAAEPAVNPAEAREHQA